MSDFATISKSLGNRKDPGFKERLKKLSAPDRKTYVDGATSQRTAARKALMNNPPKVTNIWAAITNTKWSNSDSVEALNSFLATNGNLAPLLPVGIRGDSKFYIKIGWDLLPLTRKQSKPEEQTSGLTIRGPSLDLASCFKRLNLPGDRSELRVFYEIGDLMNVPTTADTTEDKVKTGFVVVINVLDGSVWLIFNFETKDTMGNQLHFTKDDEPWGLLSSVDKPFSVGRIANRVEQLDTATAETQTLILDEIAIRGPGQIEIAEPDQYDLTFDRMEEDGAFGFKRRKVAAAPPAE